MKTSFLSRKKLLTWALPAALFAAGVIAGLVADRKLVPLFTGENTAVRELHEKDIYRLTNPLLECEGSSETIGDPELRPFQETIDDLVHAAVRQGRATRVSVYFRDLNNGPWLGVNMEEKYAPASLMKVPVMMALLKQAESDRHLLKKKLRFDGSRNDNWQEVFRPSVTMDPGTTHTVEEAIFRMIAYSDNNAVTLLARDINQSVLSRLYSDLNVSQPPTGPAKDYLDVKSCASFFRVLFNASYLGRDDSETALNLLTRTEFTRGLAAGVPAGVMVAHKFGESRSNTDETIVELHDCGIVYYPFSPYLLCVMTKGREIDRLPGVIADVSRLVYTQVDANERTHDHARPEPR